MGPITKSVLPFKANEHGEQKTDRAPESLQCYTADLEDAGPSSSTEGSESDGYSMYRAIARQVIGDPRKWRSVRDAILYFAI